MSRIETAFTKLFNVHAPICLAPMFGAVGGRLCAAVARGGGLGIIAGGPCRDIDSLAAEVDHFKSEAPAGAGINIGVVSWAAAQGPDPPLSAVLKRFSVASVWFFAPAVPPGDAYLMCKQSNVKIIAQVASMAEARMAVSAGADCLVCQGTEAGGHGLTSGRGTVAFAASAADAFRGSGVPILAAGGISSGAGVAAALALGCDGAVVGTAYLPAEECTWPQASKEALLRAEGDKTIRTRSYDVVSKVLRGIEWPAPFDSSRVMRNQFTAEYDGSEERLEAELKADGEVKAKVLKTAEAFSDFESHSILYSGEGLDLVNALESGEQLTKRLVRETHEALDRLANLRTDQAPPAQTAGAAPAAGPQRRVLIGSGGVYEASTGYSRAVRVGSTVHVAGTTSLAEDGSVLHKGDAGAQAKLALQRIVQALRDAGAGPESVVRTRMFVTQRKDCEAVMKAHGEVFAAIRPTASIIVVAGLVDPELLVEIEAEAIV